MQSDADAPWRPTLGARLAVLRGELARLNADHLHMSVMEFPCACFLGVNADGAAWLGLTCDTSSVSTDDRAAAVTFQLRPDGYRILIAPTTPDAVLIHYFEEVTELIERGTPPGDAGVTALQNWRELLASPPGVPLSDDALGGLFGELEVLEIILRNGGVLDYWTGWKHDQCDFRLPSLVVEVKSTTSANYRRVRIHGLNQLADPLDGSELILVLRRLENSPEGRSVPDLIDALVKLGASRSALLDRLHEVRYSEAHRAAYSNCRFVSREVALRRIDSNHPRLTPSMLAAVDLSAIDKIDYELNLNNDVAADLPISLETLIAESIES